MKKHDNYSRQELKLEHMMADFSVDDNNFDTDLITDSEVSDVEKKRILNMTLNKVDKIGSENEASEPRTLKETGKRLSRRSLWAFGLVAVFVLAMGGIAVANVVMDSDFVNYLKPGSDEQTALLNSSGAEVMAEAENNGWTIQTKQIVGDGHTLFLLFDIIAPEGTVLEGSNYMFQNAFVNVNNSVASAGYYFEVLEDDNPNDNKISVVLSYDTDKNLVGKTLNLNFENLTKWDPETDSDVVIAEGPWKIDVPLNYSDLSQKLDPSGDLKFNDRTYAVKELEVSPLTIYIKIGDTISNMYDKLTGNGENDDLDDLAGEVVVTMKDGSVINDMAGGSTSSRGIGLSMRYQFGKMIDPEQIAEIKLGGSVIYQAE